ncbi:restriction endonuclease subunit S [uncultured Prevotella sp.]|uniref:restriction endonuclease subunit S n=1 Tax=uncultured Prevotella sp. TaxID=159272 RepID=UPI002636EF49|nr:restriction endonuclease subunit S [uncultured Prevotella sp.]
MRKGWEYKKLGEVCYPKSKIQRATKCFGASDEIVYIDISSIDNSVQEVNSITSFTMSNAPSRAQQKVEYGDIIVSTVRPNLKNVALIKQHDSNLVASSGFCVLRPTDDIERNYLFRYITSDIFTQHIMKLTTGANYPAVRDLDVRDSTIPLPPQSTQLAIVSELDKINELIRLKKEQLKDFDNLAQSLFYEMFGDPVENEKGWEVKKLGEIAKSAIGLTYKPENVTKELSGTIVLRSSNIQNSILDFNNIVRVNVPVKEDKMVNDGDILMCSRNGSFRLVGKVALIKNLKKRMSYGAFMTIIRSQYNPYLFEYFKTPAFRQYLITGKTTTVNQITVKMLNNLTLPLPPLSHQHLFSQRIEQIEREKSEVQKSIQDLETLLASRMQYWFE